MVLDTSAIIAIILNEPVAEQLIAVIRQGSDVYVGSPTVFEAGMVLSSRLQQDARALIQSLLRQLRAREVPFDDEHARVATGAFLRFGKGRHPAALNFGDCMSYAVAILRGMPLLYVGNDFRKTDVLSAV